MPWYDCVFVDWNDCIWQDWDDCEWDKFSIVYQDSKRGTRTMRQPAPEAPGNLRRPYLEGNPGYVEDNQRYSDEAYENALLKVGRDVPANMVFKQPYRYKDFQKMKYRNEPSFPHHETMAAQSMVLTPGDILGTGPDIEYEWQWVRYFDNTRWVPSEGEWFDNRWLQNNLNPNSVLLIHSNNSDGSTTFVDSGAGFNSPHIITHSGNVHHEIDQKKFGSTSIYFDGYRDILKLDNSDDWNFGIEDFTVDFWVRFSAFPSFSGMISTMGPADVHNGWLIYTLNNQLRVWMYPADLIITTIELNTWYHVAAVKYNNTIKAFVNGISIGSQTSQSIPYPGSGLVIGKIYTGGDNYYLNGYLDEIRVMKGIAYWTANFTPPSGPYGSIDLVDKGDWTKDFRPRKFRITFDNATANVSLRDSNEIEIYGNETYASGTEVNLTFAGADIDRLTVTGSGEITDIEFEVQIEKGKYLDSDQRPPRTLPTPSRESLPDPNPIKYSVRLPRITGLKNMKVLPDGRVVGLGWRKPPGQQ